LAKTSVLEAKMKQNEAKIQKNWLKRRIETTEKKIKPQKNREKTSNFDT
jgi:hypothetical protein